MTTQEAQLKLNELYEYILNHPRCNQNILAAFGKVARYLPSHKKIVVSISGGSDSDIMLDMLSRFDPDKQNIYVFFDTGIEYKATHRHLDYLEVKYGIKIERVPAEVPVPKGCKKHGQPFWSKHISGMIGRLQKHGFMWEDAPLDVLLKKYSNCRGALRWWCNDFERKIDKRGNVKESKFNIGYVTFLKEFMILQPPSFKISEKCCNGAKKSLGKLAMKRHKGDLKAVGVRKAEGGIRSSAYKSCFSESTKHSYDDFRPIFWITNKDKIDYEALFNITHSDCYCVYGLTGTGCAGCPFGKEFEFELTVIKQYEPHLYKAVNNIFGDSYDYTRKYIAFRKEMQAKKKLADSPTGQLQMEGL